MLHDSTNSNAPRLAPRARRSWVRLRHDPTALVALILVIVLTYLVLGPVLSMLTSGFRVQFRDAARLGATAGSFTLAYVERVFTSRISSVFFWRPLQRTLLVSVAVLVSSVSIGFLLAWILVRTDFPGRKTLSKLMVIPYIAPAWTFALAWLTLFKNRRIAGSLGIAEGLGFNPPDWFSYGAIPIIVTLTFSLFPLAFLLFGGALQSVDAQLEESARIVGAPRRTILRRIVVPLLLPALMSSGLLILARSIGSFGTPYLLGSPVNYTVLGTSLFGAIQRGEAGAAAILTAVIVMLGIAVVGVDIYFVREARRFVTVSGKGGSRSPSRLGALIIPAALFVYGVLLVSLILPLAALFLSTITRAPGVFRLDNFTLLFWTGRSIPHFPGQPGLFHNRDIIRAAWNSLRIVSVAALLAGGLGTFVGYVSVRYSASKVAGYLRQLSFLPYLVPTIGFGAAYLTLFAVRRGPIPSLYGTIWLIVLAMAMNYLPFAARTGNAAMMQLGKEPEEAAMVCGAPWVIRFTRIVVPILKKTLVTGIILPFISGMKELVLVIFLATPGLELLTTQVLRYIDFGYTQLANAVVVVIVVTITLMTLLLQKITGTGLTSGLQGG